MQSNEPLTQTEPPFDGRGLISFALMWLSFIVIMLVLTGGIALAGRFALASWGF